MFAYIDLEPRDGKFNVCLKCHPEKTVELREKYNGIVETSFKSLMWNAVYLESDVPDKLIEELINHSVEEVVKKLSKKKRKDMKDCTKNIKNIKASPIPDTVSLMQASGTKAEQNFTSELPNVSKNTS
jgi:predicted DNA-binding protein (MmcQ/YjbR family)